VRSFASFRDILLRTAGLGGRVSLIFCWGLVAHTDAGADLLPPRNPQPLLSPAQEEALYNRACGLFHPERLPLGVLTFPNGPFAERPLWVNLHPGGTN
jgi:hypothetical protein